MLEYTGSMVPSGGHNAGHCQAIIIAILVVLQCVVVVVEGHGAMMVVEWCITALSSLSRH